MTVVNLRDSNLSSFLRSISEHFRSNNVFRLSNFSIHIRSCYGSAGSGALSTNTAGTFFEANLFSVRNFFVAFSVLSFKMFRVGHNL